MMKNQIHLYLMAIMKCLSPYQAYAHVINKLLQWRVIVDGGKKNPIMLARGLVVTPKLSLMWLDTSEQAIENIDLLLFTLESIICASSASRKI